MDGTISEDSGTDQLEDTGIPGQFGKHARMAYRYKGPDEVCEPIVAVNVQSGLPLCNRRHVKQIGRNDQVQTIS